VFFLQPDSDSQEYTIGSSITNHIVIPDPKPGAQYNAADSLHCILYPSYDREEVTIVNKSWRTTFFVRLINEEYETLKRSLTIVGMNTDIEAEEIPPGSELVMYGEAWHLSLGFGLDLHMSFIEEPPRRTPTIAQLLSNQPLAPRTVLVTQGQRGVQDSRAASPGVPGQNTIGPGSGAPNQRMLHAAKESSQAALVTEESQETIVDNTAQEEATRRRKLDERLALLLPEDVTAEKEGERTIISKTRLSVVRKLYGQGTEYPWLAVKILKSTPKNLAKCRNDWRRECAMLERLNHVSLSAAVSSQELTCLKPNIVKLVHSNIDLLMICTEFLDGDNLARIPSGSFAKGEITKIWKDTTKALEHCHLQGIAHNDIKPANIMFSRQARKATLIDFGLASKPKEVQIGGGTPSWLAPEAIEGIRGPAGDIWAFGLVMLQVSDLITIPRHSERIQMGEIATDGADQLALLEWLREIRSCVTQLPTKHDLLKRMFDENWKTRITSSELHLALRRLNS